MLHLEFALFPLSSGVIKWWWVGLGLVGGANDRYAIETFSRESKSTAGRKQVLVKNNLPQRGDYCSSCTG